MHYKTPAIVPGSKSQWATALLALAVLAAVFHSMVLYHPDTPGCEKVWMYPSYTKLNGFGKEHTRLGDKYALYLYRDDYYQRDQMNKKFVPTGIPVIFIPGNAGSYKQARSIGSLAAEVIAERNWGQDQRLDLYTADFEEDFSAFHGRTLLDQAEYINDAIRFILALYDQPNPDTPHPKSVIVIGHSMGGFIARALVGLDNYVPESVNTILTLASPHAMPPITFDAQMSSVYSLVNKYWAQAYSEDRVGRSPLSTVALVSIAGGKLDTMVPSDYASVSGLTRPSNGFATFSSGMPGVWTGIDHQAIVWCHQARAAIVNALLEILDPVSPSKTKSLEDRMKVFAKYFLSGLEPYEYNRLYERSNALTEDPKRQSTYFPKSIDLEVKASEVQVLTGHILEPPVAKYSVFKIPDHTSPNDLIQVYVNSTQSLDLLLCNKEPAKDHDLHFKCYSAQDDPIMVPYSSPYHTQPAMTGYHMKQDTTYGTFFEYNTTRDLGTRFSHVVLARKSAGLKDYLAVVNTHVQNHKAQVNASFWRMLMGGVTVKLPASQATDISLQGATSPLLSYTVKIEAKAGELVQGCYTPFIRQYVLDPFESKFQTNVLGSESTAHVFMHGLAAPYIPHVKSAASQDATNLHVQVFTPPLLASNTAKDANPHFEVRIKLDLWGTLGNLGPRYRTILVPFAIAVVAAVAVIQLHVYTATGRVVSFADGARQLVKVFVVVGIPALAALQFVLSFQSMRGLAKLMLAPLSTISDGASGIYLNGLRAQDGTAVTVEKNDLLAGVSEPELIFVAPLLVFVALGAVLTVYIVVMGLLNFVAARTGPYVSKPRATLAPSSTLVPGHSFFGVLGLACTVTAVYAPYPLVFTAAVAYILVLLGRAKQLEASASASAASGSSIKPPKTSAQAQTHFISFAETLVMLLLWTIPLGIPVLVAWVHTLVEYSFLEPCSSHRSPLTVVPVVLVAYMCRRVSASTSTSFSTALASSSSSASGESHKRVTHFISANQRTVNTLLTTSKALLAYVAVYALVLGFTEMYFLFNLVNLVCFYMVGVYGYYKWQTRN